MDPVEEDQPTPPVQVFGSQAVRSTLGRGADVDACVALVRQVDDLLVQAARHLQEGGAALACRAGCNFCCHLRVQVQPHEAIALFRHLQSQLPRQLADEIRATIKAYTRPAAGAAATSAQSQRRPCAFLVAGECAAYEVRPSACAAYHSLSKERCEQSFLDPTLPTSTAALQSLQVVAAALEEGVGSELATQGLVSAPDELHTAVAALLANPALIARWRAGRPLLKSP
jgi:Fe-S-cluster containining protein